MAMSEEFQKLEIIQYVKENDNTLFGKIELLYDACYNLTTETAKEFSNYTLHDIEHSARVIGYMNDLVKDNLATYSCLHLAMMIFAGLLHDTGMFVSDDEKKQLYNELIKKSPSFEKMDETGKWSYLQDYIRDRHGKRVRDVLNYPINKTGMLIRHIFVVDNNYDYSEIIANICQSHMEGSEWILKHLSSEKCYGRDEFNPRHIAVLLRIGDELDIDARRAPYVLYRALNIRGNSSAEWNKNGAVTNYDKISKDGDKYIISFEGTINDYDVYQKVNSYIDQVGDWIKKDISLCNGKYVVKIKLPIENKIDSDIFEKTDYQFSLNYKQITKLLMGEKIYGSKQDGLRELLQNAIDAVLLMEEIEKKKSHSSYIPLLGIEIDKSKNQINVFDHGTGMSEKILKNYFFNIGTSYYESKDFSNDLRSYSPIGHFGIGFLACFMLSSKVTLETKYYKAGSHVIRMSFDKESYNIIKYKENEEEEELFDFDHGTRIILEYDKIIPGVFKNENGIKQYVMDLLLDNNYQFVISNPQDTIIHLKKPKLVYIEDGQNQLEYEYKIEKNPFLLNVESVFDKRRFVYMIDPDGRASDESMFAGITNLNAFMENGRELNARMQTVADDEQNDIIEQTIEDTDPFFSEFVLNKYPEIMDYYRKNREIVSFFWGYLSSFLQDDELIWYDYPCIIENSRFLRFVNVYEKEGLDNALKEYKSYIRYVAILCKKGVPAQKAVLRVIGDYVNLHTDADVIEPVSLSYYKKYPIRPIRRRIRVLRKKDSYNFIGVREQYRDYNLNIYLKGIRVMDKSISLPYAIMGIKIESVVSNLLSNKYSLDVSRSSFDADNKEEITRLIACAVYSDMMKKRMFTKEEKELIGLFLKIYYNYNQ